MAPKWKETLSCMVYLFIKFGQLSDGLSFLFMLIRKNSKNIKKKTKVQKKWGARSIAGVFS